MDTELFRNWKRYKTIITSWPPEVRTKSEAAAHHLRVSWKMFVKTGYRKEIENDTEF